MIESNEYLNQVVEEQARVEEELRRPKAAQVALQAVGKRLGKGLIEFKKGATATDEAAAEEVSSHGGNGRASASSAPAVDVRVTGWFRWKTVVGVGEVELAVRGVHVIDDPLHVGLHQHALPLRADALGVDEERLHRRGDDEEGVGVRVEAE